jgi:membrane protein implicated in regulation of membrane protease activity
MNDYIGHLWMGLAIILFIAEIMTPGGFVLACLGISCLASGFISYLGFGVTIQLLIFSLASLTLFFGIRPFFSKYFLQSAGKIKTNIDALVEKTGMVSERIDPATGKGRVLVGGEDWKGVSISDEVIDVGTKVAVVRVDGAKLVVKKHQMNQGG